MLIMLIFLIRKQFLKQRSAAVVVQKYWRGYKGRKLYKMVSYQELDNKLGFNGSQTYFLRGCL